MSKSKKVLVVAAHPDDEILGCGGAMVRHAQDGDEVHVVFMADGVTSRSDNNRFEEIQVGDRYSAAECACKIVGAQSPITLGFPDNKMDTISLLDITKVLEEVLGKLQPKIIYTHHAHDLNLDHQLTHQAVMTACRPQPNASVSRIYSFEVLSSTGWEGATIKQAFSPNYFLEITKVWKEKKAALNCYQNEMRDYPHARSIEGVESLARFRGVSAGLQLAEAFQLERSITTAD